MGDYTLQELECWQGRVEAAAAAAGLDFYPQEFEICSYEDMLAYEAYSGMPSRYPHWSFGKAYERLRTLYKYNLSGLPYEMVINANPCLAYLMRDNSLLLQILTMAHVYGHNDFFKNNRLFQAGTRAAYTVEMFKSNAARVRRYVQDPSIGWARVERVLDAAHSLRWQTERSIGTPRQTLEQQRQRLLEKHQQENKDEYAWLTGRKPTPLPDVYKIPLEPEEDILLFLMEYATLEEWEKDLLNIVRTETRYFLPQVETKIMNEGWASYWHYQLLNHLELPPHLHLEFIKQHNFVVRPLPGRINPYCLGFKIFETLAQRDGDKAIFAVRATERDQSFLRRFVTRELCEELHLFTYAGQDGEYIVTDIADDDGWERVRDTLLQHAGLSVWPVIRVTDVRKRENLLVLSHDFDGRELDENYAQETVRYAATLWGGRVRLETKMSGKDYAIVADGAKTYVKRQ